MGVIKDRNSIRLFKLLAPDVRLVGVATVFGGSHVTVYT